MKKATTPWVRKAEADYSLAKRVARANTTFHDAVCFHCQQCVEKYLKGLLVEQGLVVPKSHDLDRLLSLLLPLYASLRSFRRGLLYLSAFAVETRYPGFDASKRQAAAALRWAGRVRLEARSLLGVRPPRKRPS